MWVIVCFVVVTVRGKVYSFLLLFRFLFACILLVVLLFVPLWLASV